MMSEVPFRVGHGYDVHRFAEGRKLILGGIEIEHERGLKGHSDADCILHALADAIFGGMGLRDIGHYFPNTDSSIEGIHSRVIVEKAVEEAKRLGYGIMNADMTVIAEEPKIGKHIDAMKQVVSSILKVSIGQVGIKATTHEKLGALGKAEGIAAHAVVLLGKM